MGIITINKIKVFAFHGCMPEETKIGTNYEIDIYMETDFSEAAENDDLSKTIDYVAVNEIVQKEMAIPSKLIEHVGKRIFDSLMSEFLSLDNCSVKITKFNAPMGTEVESVSIVVES